METFKTKLTREQRIDLAYELMVIKANGLELKYGERTHSETIKEGRTNFTYKVIFCNENEELTYKKITVTTKGF